MRMLIADTHKQTRVVGPSQLLEFETCPSRRPDITVPATVLSQRKSTRRFARGAVSIETLSACIRAASPREPLHVEVVVLAIEDIRPGYWQLDSAGQLQLVADFQLADVQREMLRQPELGTAAAILVLVADLSRIHNADAPHGYRRAVVEAGAAANRAYLTALSRGLAACIFEGLLPDARRDLVGRDGATELVGIAIGRAAHKRVLP